MNYLWFRNRWTHKVCIGRIGKEGSNSSIPKTLKKFIIRRRAIWKWCFIKLPITRMYKVSNWRLNEKSNRIWNRVINRKWCNLKMLSNTHWNSSSIFWKLWKWCIHLTLLELNKLVCHRCCINGSISSELLECIVYPSDMVNMTVRNTESYHLFSACIRKIGNTWINSILILIRKLQSHINNKEFVFIFKSNGVKPYLLTSSKWNNSKGSFFMMTSFFLSVSKVLFKRLCWSKKWKRFLKTHLFAHYKSLTRTNMFSNLFSSSKKVSWRTRWIISILLWFFLYILWHNLIYKW